MTNETIKIVRPTNSCNDPNSKAKRDDRLYALIDCPEERLSQQGGTEITDEDQSLIERLQESVRRVMGSSLIQGSINERTAIAIRAISIPYKLAEPSKMQLYRNGMRPKPARLFFTVLMNQVRNDLADLLNEVDDVLVVVDCRPPTESELAKRRYISTVNDQDILPELDDNVVARTFDADENHTFDMRIETMTLGEGLHVITARVA